MFGLSAFSEIPFGGLPSDNIILGSASIDADATVVADGYRIKFFAGSITANGDVTAIGYRVQQ
jgi:hypothetical protein